MKFCYVKLHCLPARWGSMLVRLCSPSLSAFFPLSPLTMSSLAKLLWPHSESPTMLQGPACGHPTCAHTDSFAKYFFSSQDSCLCWQHCSSSHCPTVSVSTAQAALWLGWGLRPLLLNRTSSLPMYLLNALFQHSCLLQVLFSWNTKTWTPSPHWNYLENCTFVMLHLDYSAVI